MNEKIEMLLFLFPAPSSQYHHTKQANEVQSLSDASFKQHALYALLAFNNSVY